MTKLETGLIIGLIVIVVAAGITLFSGGNYIKLLRLQIEGKTEKQDILQKDINALNDSINNRVGRYSDLQNIIDSSKKERKEIEKNIPKIDEEYKDAIIDIANDDISKDFRATVKIFKEHRSN